jgi:hypothetical protein
MSKMSIVFYKKVGFTYCYEASVDSAVSIATSCGLDCRSIGVLSPDKGKVFLPSTSSRLVLGLTQPPPIQWILG